MTEQKKFQDINTVTNWEQAYAVLETVFKVQLSEKQKQKLNTFYELLLAANERMNLTKLSSLSDFLTFHLLDTVLIMSLLPPEPGSNVKYLDLGSGCGVPGFILHILLEARAPQSLLCDSRSKRAEYLENLAKTLNLEASLKVAGMRSEALAKEKSYKKAFNLVTARAFAKPLETLKAAAPFLQKDGSFIYQTSFSLSEDPEYKSALGHSKLKIAAEQYFNLGGKPRFVGSVKF